MSNISNSSSLSSLSSLYNPYNTNNLTATNTAGTDFNALLGSGALNNYNNPYNMNYGNSMSPQTASMMSEGANLFTNRLLNKFSPTDTGDTKDDFYTSSTFGNAFLGTGTSTMDMLSTIAANTIPFIKTTSKWGTWLQNTPQLFQMITGTVAGLQAFKMVKQEPSPSMLASPNIEKELQADLDLNDYG